ncbi:hypothetical protein T484DRAFT_1837834, partial [Baffinella frigidus]
YKALRDPGHLGVPSLKTLALRILDRKIQFGVHDPGEDARTAMRIYQDARTAMFIYQAYADVWEREAVAAGNP